MWQHLKDHMVVTACYRFVRMKLVKENKLARTSALKNKKTVALIQEIIETVQSREKRYVDNRM